MVEVIFFQSRNTDTDIENKCMDTKGEEGRRDAPGAWDGRTYTIDSVHRTENRWEHAGWQGTSAVLCVTSVGSKSKKEGTCVSI